MKKMLILLILCASCSKQMSEEEKQEIQKNAYSVLTDSAIFTDSLTDVKNSIKIETKYDLLYEMNVDVIINSTQKYRDSLNVAVYAVETNFDHLKGIVDEWDVKKNVGIGMIKEAEQEAEIAKNAK